MFLLLPGGGLCSWKLELADGRVCAELPKKPKAGQHKNKNEEKQITQHKRKDTQKRKEKKYTQLREERSLNFLKESKSASQLLD